MMWKCVTRTSDFTQQSEKTGSRITLMLIQSHLICVLYLLKTSIQLPLTGRCWHPSAPNQSWKKKCFLGQCIIKCIIRIGIRTWREAVVAQAIGLKTKNHGSQLGQEIFLFSKSFQNNYKVCQSNFMFHGYQELILQGKSTWGVWLTTHHHHHPIALRPFQFGLDFPYNWCPFLSIQCFRSPSFDTKHP